MGNNKISSIHSLAKDGKTRCPWCLKSDTYIRYHDEEWGRPVHDDRVHFEFLVLEGAQAGLSWETILNRREGYRRLFADFDPQKVAQFTAAHVEKMLQDTSIIRNRLKVNGAITNARLFLSIQEEYGSFDRYIWEFVGGEPMINQWKNINEIPAKTEQSDALSKDLQKRGFKFTGSTIMYAHMQACGLVDDHLMECYRWSGKK